MTGRFPDGFRWGAATSSYQIEGAVADDGRGASIWDTFCHTPGRILDGTTGDVACDHFHRYADDVALMAELGVQDYRFSVAWPRVQPSGFGPVNKAGLDFYARLVDALLDAGIRPLVTLYHWDLPQPLQDAGGWPLRDTAQRFAEYAAAVADRLGDRVPAFTTLNEPWCTAFLGYASGDHAPGQTDLPAAYASAYHLLLGHGLAAEAIRGAAGPDVQLSITINPANARPASAADEDVRAARLVELTRNDLWFEPVLRATLPADLVSATQSFCDWAFVRDGDLPTMAAPIDFLGINYYNPHFVAGARPASGVAAPVPGVPQAWDVPGPQLPRTSMGWPVDSASFTELLVALGRRYPETPIVVTENGSAWDDEVASDGAVHDERRCDYLRRHVAAVADAIESGVDIRGYFAWSLLDNFEWAWGLSQRFGIVRVDFDTQKRTVKDSGRLYQQIIAAHGVQV